ncbi:HNH endonuclease [Rhizobiales bacterium]|uniref:HNH endonuclease n=1 Tax=Hongsoonwoonella zoysiae TaxID=2821844 RepID=UPI001561ABB0|nr:HNH endonuclease [Hongsoonwoonella zoysiae]
MCKKIQSIRKKKFKAQNGRCFYCRSPMWEPGSFDAFVRTHELSRQSADFFRCTAEHLHPRSDGGKDQASNIVAACLFCNATRHKAKTPMEPGSYALKARRRLAAGKWHRWVSGLSEKARPAQPPGSSVNAAFNTTW